MTSVLMLDVSLEGERYVYKFVCSPEALFQMTSAGGGGGGGGGDHQRMLKLESSSGQCVGGAESNQFCQVLNQMYGNNYQYYEGAAASPQHGVTDYLTAYRQSQAHKQHYIQVCHSSVSSRHLTVLHSTAASLGQSRS